MELAPLADPALVPQAMATVLDVKEQAGQSLQATLAETLCRKGLLLLMDNCEHLLDACAEGQTMSLEQAVAYALEPTV